MKLHDYSPSSMPADLCEAIGRATIAQSYAEHLIAELYTSLMGADAINSYLLKERVSARTLRQLTADAVDQVVAHESDRAKIKSELKRFDKLSAIRNGFVHANYSVPNGSLYPVREHIVSTDEVTGLQATPINIGDINDNAIEMECLGLRLGGVRQDIESGTLKRHHPIRY